MKNVLVVFNYNAGRKKAIFCKKQLHKYLFSKTKKFKFISIDELDAVEFDDYDSVIAVGGDGTVNKVVKYIAKTDKLLAIIPVGTANLLAAKLGFSSNIKKSLRIIDKEKIKTIDLINVNEKQCVLRLGIGYDADIICKTPQSLKNKFGYFAYFIAGIIFALRLTPKKYEITCDERVLTVEASNIIVANAANMYHNLISISNKSDLADGLFEIFVLKTKNPIAYFYEFLRILIGIKRNNSRALYLTAKTLKIKNSWCTCHIDGEKTRLKGNIDINIVKNSVKVFCD